MELIYERDLKPMKLYTLKGPRQDAAVLALANRLGISRQQMRKILIEYCDLMTLENIGPRLEAADACADADAAALSLPQLTTALGILSPEAAAAYLARVKAGEPVEAVKKSLLEDIS